MTKAVWNGQILAESNDTILVEGNHYFPLESINKTYFKESTQTSVCPWKGLASYFDIEVDGQINAAAAWIYQEPNSAASNIKNHIAFWKGVQVKL